LLAKGIGKSLDSPQVTLFAIELRLNTLDGVIHGGDGLLVTAAQLLLRDCKGLSHVAVELVGFLVLQFHEPIEDWLIAFPSRAEVGLNHRAGQEIYHRHLGAQLCLGNQGSVLRARRARHSAHIRDARATTTNYRPFGEFGPTVFQPERWHAPPFLGKVVRVDEYFVEGRKPIIEPVAIDRFATAPHEHGVTRLVDGASPDLDILTEQHRLILHTFDVPSFHRQLAAPRSSASSGQPAHAVENLGAAPGCCGRPAGSIAGVGAVPDGPIRRTPARGRRRRCWAWSSHADWRLRRWRRYRRRGVAADGTRAAAEDRVGQARGARRLLRHDGRELLQGIDAEVDHLGHQAGRHFVDQQERGPPISKGGQAGLIGAEGVGETEICILTATGAVEAAPPLA
jgi:hypothetical protein